MMEKMFPETRPSNMDFGYGSLFTVMLFDIINELRSFLHFKHPLFFLFSKGSVPSFLTVSRLLLSPVGCVFVIFTPSVGLITHFLVNRFAVMDRDSMSLGNVSRGYGRRFSAARVFRM